MQFSVVPVVGLYMAFLYGHNGTHTSYTRQRMSATRTRRSSPWWKMDVRGKVGRGRRMVGGERLIVKKRDYTVALDGERAFSVNRSQQLEMEGRRDGPLVIDVNLALKIAAAQGLFSLAQGN